MKKTLFVVILLSLFSFNSFAQACCPVNRTISTTIDMTIATRWNNQEGFFDHLIQFSRNGVLKYWEKVDRNYRNIPDSGESASYYIRNNVLFIIWNDGVQETAPIHYDNGKITSIFRKIRLTEL